MTNTSSHSQKNFSNQQSKNLASWKGKKEMKVGLFRLKQGMEIFKTSW